MLGRLTRTWLFVSSLLLPGCASNMLGREIETSEHPYAFQGQSLGYWVGVPRDIHTQTLPVAIFLEGDGTQCQPYSASAFRRFVLRYTGNHILIRPRTYINTLCETEAFRRFDFLSRIDELHALITSVRKQWPNAPLYLIGHSAGAHVAILYAERNETPIAGIANLGGGVRELSAILPAILQERVRKGDLSQEQANTETRELQATLQDVKQHATSTDPFWGRTYRFWNQMFFSNVDARWISTEIPILIIHGEKDLESVPFSTVNEARTAFAQQGRKNVRFSFYPSLGHDLLNTTVLKEVDAWIAETEKARASAAAPQK